MRREGVKNRMPGVYLGGRPIACPKGIALEGIAYLFQPARFKDSHADRGRLRSTLAAEWPAEEHLALAVQFAQMGDVGMQQIRPLALQIC